MGQSFKHQIFFLPPSSTVKGTLHLGNLDIECPIHLPFVRRLFRNLSCLKSSVMTMSRESGVQTGPHMSLSMRNVKHPQQTNTYDGSLHAGVGVVAGQGNLTISGWWVLPVLSEKQKEPGPEWEGEMAERGRRR